MPRSLEVGHVVFIQAANTYFRVSNVREWQQRISTVLTASQTLTNQEITDLKSPNDRIYHVRSIALEDDVNFTYKYRQKSQIGLKAPKNLTIEDAPAHAPWDADIWMYNYSPFYDITENVGIAKTAVIIFAGEEYELEELQGRPSGAFAIVDG